MESCYMLQDLVEELTKLRRTTGRARARQALAANVPMFPVAVSELRVVVLGGNRSGKTSLINKILGPGDHYPRCLQTRQGEVGGRTVVMVDTVGWWRIFLLVDTAEFIKQKLQLSVSMCPPGPHAFLLTIMTDIPFDEHNRRAIEEHLSLLGENVWKHIIVVFTRGETLGTKTIEQHIERQGKALKWLLEKCGNKYCVFDSKKKEDGQVTTLLEQIDPLVRVNGGRHFQLDEKTLQEVQEKTRTVKEKAADRRMIKQSKTWREGKSMPSSEIAILVLGWVNSKKTSTINLILNREEQRFTKRTVSAELHSGEVEGLKLSVVDTPGWWKFFPAELTPDWVKTELQRSLTVGSNAPHAVLLAVPADTTFWEEQRKITEDNMKMFGEQVWRHTIVLFTCGDLLGDTSIEEHIESEGEPLKWLVEKCGNRYHVFDNLNTEDRSQVRELLESIKEMEAPNEILAVDQTLEQSENKELAKLLNDLWEEENKQMEANAEVSSRLAPIDFAQETQEDDAQDPLKESYLNLPKELREKFEQEFRRQTILVMERVWNVYFKGNPADDDSGNEKQQAIQKVTWWMERWIREWCRQEVEIKHKSGGDFECSEHEEQLFSQALGEDDLTGHDYSSGHGSYTDESNVDSAEVNV